MFKPKKEHIIPLSPAEQEEVTAFLDDQLKNICPSKSVTQTLQSIEVKEQRVLHRLIEVIKSLASSGLTRLTMGEGGLGLGASDSRQGKYDAYIVQIKSEE